MKIRYEQSISRWDENYGDTDSSVPYYDFLDSALQYLHDKTVTETFLKQRPDMSGSFLPMLGFVKKIL